MWKQSIPRGMYQSLCFQLPREKIIMQIQMNDCLTAVQVQAVCEPNELSVNDSFTSLDITNAGRKWCIIAYTSRVSVLAKKWKKEDTSNPKK